MKTTKTVVVEKEVTTWKCDFCDFEIDNEDNRGCCGSAPIMTCHFCGNDACRKHRESIQENSWAENSEFVVCQDCKPKVDMCQHITSNIIGRYDSWVEVMEKIYNNFEEYKDYLEDYIPPE